MLASCGLRSRSKRLGALRRRSVLILFQLGQQNLLDVCGQREGSSNFRPEFNGRRRKQILRQRHDLKIIVEMRSKPAMLCSACNAWMAFPIMADTTKVMPRGISDEDVSPEVDGLS